MTEKELENPDECIKLILSFAAETCHDAFANWNGEPESSSMKLS